VTRRLLSLCAALAVLPTMASAQGGARRSWVPGESGFVLGFDLGGGTTFGAGSRYTSAGRFDGELSVGYEFPYGIRPEIAVALGIAPGQFFAIRPGVHVAIPETPFYVRGALDWTTISGVGTWRWLIAGAGGEIRLTGVLSGFAEVDLGLPVRSNTGVETLLRAGISVRL
jgi:hypothetical protein